MKEKTAPKPKTDMSENPQPVQPVEARPKMLPPPIANLKKPCLFICATSTTAITTFKALQKEAVMRNRKSILEKVFTAPVRRKDKTDTLYPTEKLPEIVLKTNL